MRGIGVAVMCRTCGTSPSGPLASSAARWRTPKRCCSSTTTTARRAKRTSSSSSACVPTTNDSSPVASLLSVSARRDALVEPVSSARRTASPGMSAWSVAKCCSARTSVGAMNAACMSCSTARRIACSATTVLPEPTSPMSSRCIGRASASSSSSIGDRRALVAGELERQQLLAPAPREVGRRVERRRAARRPALGAAAQQRELGEQELVEGEPAAAALEVAGVGGDERGRAVGQAPRRARAGRQRIDGVVGGAEVLAHEREDLRRGQPHGRGVVRDRPGRSPCFSLRPRVPLDAKRVARRELAVQHEPRALRILRLASHGWLKNVAFIIPVSSATIASTSGFIPRRRTGRLAIERTSTTTVAPSPAVSVATVRASRRSRGRCSSRSPTVSRPSAAAASAAFGGVTFSGLRSADGRGQRSGAARSSSWSSSSAVAKAVGTHPSWRVRRRGQAHHRPQARSPRTSAATASSSEPPPSCRKAQ